MAMSAVSFIDGAAHGGGLIAGVLVSACLLSSEFDGGGSKVVL